MKSVTVEVNGTKRVSEIEPRQTLADFLREHCRLTATYLGCEHGACGACTVVVDGKATRSCLRLAVMCDGHSVQTLEGFGNDGIMELLRRHFHEGHALQCGFCTPGMLVTARDILLRMPLPRRRNRPSPAQRPDLPLHGLRQHRQRDRRGRESLGEPHGRGVMGDEPRSLFCGPGRSVLSETIPSRSTSRRTILRIGTAVATLTYAAAYRARAGEDRYPARAVTIVVPYAAGGGIDGVTRVLAQRLGERLGQSFVVENRVGAGGIIASADVARSTGDGCTLLMASDAQLAIQVALRKHLDYDPEKDFAPIALVGSTPFALLVNPSTAIASVGDLIKLARSKPDELTFASSGIGSSPHLVTELFMSMTGTRMRHIPYRGTSEALTDVIGGRVDLIFSGLTGVRSLLDTGKLRALGVSSRKRLTILPSVPTIAEAGVADFEATSFVTLVAPAATPPAILTDLSTALNRILATPEIQRTFENVGYLAEPSPSPEELKKFIRTQVARWSSVVARAGLTHSQ